MKHLPFLVTLLSASSFGSLATPVYLEDQFELPDGFRIYRAAGGDWSGVAQRSSVEERYVAP